MSKRTTYKTHCFFRQISAGIALCFLFYGCAQTPKQTVEPAPQIEEQEAPVQPSIEPTPELDPEPIESNHTKKAAPVPSCIFESITGVAEVLKLKDNYAELVFHPGELLFTVRWSEISDYLSKDTEAQEIKAKIQKPLNEHCERTQIFFFR